MMEAADFDLILLAEHRLGLPPLFYVKMQDVTDDWTFILKLHALFEGTLHKLFAEKATQFEFKEPLPSDRDSFCSKVEIAAGLFFSDEVAQVPARDYLLARNRLRNLITHNLAFINLELSRDVGSLSELEFQKAARALAVSFPAESLSAAQCREVFGKLTSTVLEARPPRHRINTLREFFFNYTPKPAIWAGGAAVLSILSLCLHIQPCGDSLGRDPRMAAVLQDLSHDHFQSHPCPSCYGTLRHPTHHKVIKLNWRARKWTAEN